MKKRRSGLSIMLSLVGLVKPLLPVMCLAIFLGVIGYLCAISLTILAGFELVYGISLTSATALSADILGAMENFPAGKLLVVLVVVAVLRGFLHYGEQYCNHFIAFKLLAIIRHKVFAALRKLCPAKLEGRDKGNLISVITSDIELLEVFYAHTISPIAIATIISILMSVFIGAQYPAAGLYALCAYLVIGLVLPLILGRLGASGGMEFRDSVGDLSSFVLDSLYGLDETIQYGNGSEREQKMSEKSIDMGRLQKKLNTIEVNQRSITNLLILAFSLGMLCFMATRYDAGLVSFRQMLIATMAMMGSFGPVVALSNLSNNLNQTLASGERVLSLLEEVPEVEEKAEGLEMEFTSAALDHVDFAYEEDQILQDYSLSIQKGQIVGIHGASGCGKSTILKLLMRFWDVDKGQVTMSGHDVKEIKTSALRDAESYVTQETWLFHDTIAANIAIGKPEASMEEIQEAAKKASIHDFIMTLPQGYMTQVGELGDTLSGGERQRIGIARCFLSDGDLLLMDEPTSNLDALNEGIILKSLKQEKGHKTIVLVSHRQSTMNIADLVFEK